VSSSTWLINAPSSFIRLSHWRGDLSINKKIDGWIDGQRFHVPLSCEAPEVIHSAATYYTYRMQFITQFMNNIHTSNIFQELRAYSSVVKPALSRPREIMPLVIYTFGLIYHQERYESISRTAAAVRIAYRFVLSESMRVPRKSHKHRHA